MRQLNTNGPFPLMSIVCRSTILDRCHKQGRPLISSRRPPFIMLQQSAEPFTANDLAPVTILLCHSHNGHISNPLVRPFFVIVGHEPRDDMFEMFLAKHHEVVQALLLNGLDKPLNIGGDVGATRQ